jgi:hypothetical protein
MNPHDWLADIAPAVAAQNTWQDGSYDADTIFHLDYTPAGPFAVACGAGLLTEHVRKFKFTPDVIQRMGQMRHDATNMFSESFLNHLQRLRLSTSVWSPPEGLILLPGEPLLILRGPLLQVRLLESALVELIWNSTHYATLAAQIRWDNQSWKEEDTPEAPAIPFQRTGWATRAAYIGGGSEPVALRAPQAGEGLIEVWRETTGQATGEVPYTQIRRLYKGQQAIGDLWLTQEQEKAAGVSRSTASILHATTGAVHDLKFTRFQNVYQTILSRGRVVQPKVRIPYLRRRTLKQLDAFHEANLATYPHGSVAG